jgi:VWFA-related protein
LTRAAWSPIGQAAAAREAAFGSSNVAEQASLRDMADATGGVPYLNRNDLDGALEEAIAAGADYYSLSYVPPLTKYDGQYHTIDVKVDRPNLHLKYRPGYTSVDLTKPAAASDRRSRQRRAAATGLA